jgi:hypothetical protein
MGTSEIQQLSPELPKSPSADDYRLSGVDSPRVGFESECGKREWSIDAATPGSPTEKPGESKSFLGKVVSKLKFWRRISDPGSVRDAVNAAQRGLTLERTFLPLPLSHKR